MKNANNINTYEFLQNLVLNLNSSTNLSEAMLTTFQFLSQYLPLDAISLHRFLPNLHSVHLDFLLTQKNFYELNLLMPSTTKHIEELERHELVNDISYGESWYPTSLASHFNNFLSDFIPYADRTYMVTILTAGDEVVGHLGFIGNGVHCFTKEHEELVEIMKDSFGLAMKNLLQYQKIANLQKRLEGQKQEEQECNVQQELTIMGQSTELLNTLNMVEQLAKSDAPVLIMGETGTGKELIADRVQALSARKDKPYVKINCGAIPESLIDSEFFGYQKGAFTGAMFDREGIFEQASGGTLFLDEVGELSLQSQVRLLRVLQDNIITRVGGNTPIKVDVRIITATNKSLNSMIKQGAFRSDLYHRINVFPLVLPPLRERIDDLPLLIHHFIQKTCIKMNIAEHIELADDAINFLREYPWPGNIRELKNLIERAITLHPHGKLQLAHYLPYINEEYTHVEAENIDIKKLIQEEVASVLAKSSIQTREVIVADEKVEVQGLDEATAKHIIMALKQCRYKISGKGGAAELLQIHPNTLRNKMQKLNIKLEDIA